MFGDNTPLASSIKVAKIKIPWTRKIIWTLICMERERPGTIWEKRFVPHRRVRTDVGHYLYVFCRGTGMWIDGRAIFFFPGEGIYNLTFHMSITFSLWSIHSLNLVPENVIRPPNHHVRLRTHTRSGDLSYAPRNDCRTGDHILGQRGMNIDLNSWVT
jgi:hypothetical protein